MLSSKNLIKKNQKNNNISQSRNSIKRKIIQYRQYIYKKISKKYISTKQYIINIINNIIYNEKAHIVATFKDYLILDDTNEFLKRYYTEYESKNRLPKFFEYYDTYSKIYPNYTSLPEGKYIYKNILKKQRMIDIQEEMEINNKKNYSIKSFEEVKKENDVFSTDVIDSILNETNKEEMEILFNINRDNYLIEEQKFNEKVFDLIDLIEKYENRNNNAFSYINIENISPDNIRNELNKSSKNIKTPVNINNYIFKKYSNNNSITNLKNNISSNFSLIFSNKYNKKNNFLNLHSNKHNPSSNSNIINDSNNPKTDRTLIEKIENNLLKLTKKNITNNKKNSSYSQKKKYERKFIFVKK